MTRTFLPTKAFKSPRVLVTEEQAGEAVGSGDYQGGESLVLVEDSFSLVRERRLVFDERLTIQDAQIARAVVKNISERLGYTELVNAYLNKSVASSQRLSSPVSSNLSANFGRGGFGQLGFGGTIDVTG